MKRGLLQGVVGLLILLIGAGPACACAAGGMTMTPAKVASEMPAVSAEGAGAHDCCTPAAKSAQPADMPHGQECPHCQLMTTSVKTVQDHQSAAAWGFFHLVAIAPVALLDVPADGAINAALFSPVWSPPLLLDDLFHTFCLLTL
jgi:hypothetical protein